MVKARARARFGGSLAGSDRFERKDATFHERIREALRELAERIEVERLERPSGL